jgi:ubiquinone/menaquinone biosynthesis C-methylase UbiE
MSRVFAGWIDRLLAKPIRHLFENHARLLKGYAEQGMTVLDVGCGTGYYSLGMARLVGPKGRVIAVDTKPEAIATLRRKAENDGLSEQIEARPCSPDDLDLADLDGKIDFALAVYVVHHAKEACRLMSDVYRALKHGGKLLVVEPRHHASAAACESTEAAARRAGFALVGHPRLKRDWAVTFMKA